MGRGFVYLVGAGPGDPGLVTLRAREILGRAESVIYDHLVHPEILSWAPPGAERVPMGKVGHAEQCPQAEITLAITERARQGRVVVRLKGGDPSIFGRVGEEALALAESGVPLEIVPGVTAASAAAAEARIPLTHRDWAPSVTLVTGHRRDEAGDGPSIPWADLARIGGTLVVYMGVRHLEQTARQLVAAGRDPGTPVAFVRRVTWPDQEFVEGTLGDIAEKVRDAKLSPPALAIIGEVVKLHRILAQFEDKPLKKKRILVTRSAGQAEEFSRMLRARWGQPVVLPLIELRAYGHKSALDASLRRLFAYDWVVFSSVNAVEFTFRKLDEMGLDARAFGAARVCAVGPKTAQTLARRGIRADVVPETYVAEALVEALTTETRLEGASVLIPRAREARELIPSELEKRGARVEVLAVYENVRPAQYPSEALGALRRGELDLVTLASSSAARNYAELCREQGLGVERLPCAVIGPATRKTAEASGLRVVVMPEVYTLEGMLESIEDYFRTPG